MPSMVPMPPATMVPMTPTSSETRAPKISRLSTSRPWKSVPSKARVLPPVDQNGGSKIFAPGIGSVGSYGAIAVGEHRDEHKRHQDRQRQRRGRSRDRCGSAAPVRGAVGGSGSLCKGDLTIGLATW